MTVHLPQELLSRIVSSLHYRTDQRTLKSLSLASNHFLESSQSILFSHIVLSNRLYNPSSQEKKSPGEKFLDLLNSSPRLARHIKRLTILDSGRPGIWIPEDTKLIEAIDKLDLPRIESFRFALGPRVGWLELSPSVRAAIVKICQSPSLAHLTIERVPIALVGVCTPSLKHLDAYNTTTYYGGGIEPIPRASPIILRSLQINHRDELGSNVEHLLSNPNHIRLDSLRYLEVTAANILDHSPTSKLLGHCAGSLKTFVFEPCDSAMGSIRPLRDAIDFGVENCHLLNCLELRIDVTVPDHRDKRKGLEWAYNFIERIPPSNVIAQINLALEWDLSGIPGELYGLPVHAFDVPLRALGEIFIDTERFPHLRDVYVEITTDNPDDPDDDRIEEFVRDALAIPLERALLKMKTHPHFLYEA